MSEEEVLGLINEDVKNIILSKEAIWKSVIETYDGNTKAINQYLSLAIVKVGAMAREFLYEHEVFYVKIHAYYIIIEEAVLDRYYKHLVEFVRSLGFTQFSYNDKQEKNLKKMIKLECLAVRSQFNPRNDWIPYTNGFYNYETEEFIEQFEGAYYTAGFTVPFIEDMECPEFKKFIAQILPNETDRLKVLSFLAYSFTTRNDIQIEHIWTGNGNNGKSTLTDIVKFIMGELSSSFSLRKIMRENDRFTKAMMRNVRLNVGSEISAKKFKADGIAELKEYQTAKMCTGEIKNQKERQDWVKYTKNIYDINNTPTVSEYMDWAFYRRYDIIHFPLRLTSEQIDTGLLDRLLANEGPQIARYILSFYKGCDKIIRDTNPDEIKHKWILHSHTVFAFLELFEEVGDHTPFDLCFQYYKEWCREVGREIEDVARNKFSSLLASAHKKPYRLTYGDRVFLVPFSCTYKEHRESYFDIYPCRLIEGEMFYEWEESSKLGNTLPSPFVADVSNIKKRPPYVVRVVLMEDGNYAYFRKREASLNIEYSISEDVIDSLLIDPPQDSIIYEDIGRD